MHIRRNPFETVAELAYELLRHPMTIDDLVDELGPTVPTKDPFGLLDWLLSDDPRLIWMRGDLFWRLDSIYDGVTFTHRLTESEVERGVLVDDSEWSDLIRHFESVQLGDDEMAVAVNYSRDDEEVLVEGLELVIATLSQGALCGLAATASGLEFLPVVDEVEPSTEILAAFSVAFDRASNGIMGPIEIADVIRDGFSTDRETWIGVLPPQEELAVAAGFQVRDDHLAPTSFDWDNWQTTAPVRAASVRFRLDADGNRNLTTVVDDYSKWCDRDRSLAVTIGATPSAVHLSDPDVAQAFVAVLNEYGEEGLDDLGQFVQQAAELVDLEYRAGCRWIESLGVEAAGDLVVNERLLRESLSIDPDFDRAHATLGWLLFDQSNYVEAYHHLVAAESGSELLDLLAAITAPARSGAGRNDPCGCGSGRKFKRCHGASTLPFSDRLIALYDKAARTINESRGIPDWWAWPADWPGDSHLWREGLRQLDALGTVADILLAEGGQMREFIERRGSLLPADEVEVLQQWLQTPRQLWLVISVDPDLERVDLEALSGSGSDPESPDPESSGPPAGLVSQGSVVKLEGRALTVLDEGDTVIARLLQIGGDQYRPVGAVMSVREGGLADALTMMAEPDLSPSETARRFVEFAGLHEDPAESQVVCFSRFDSTEDDLESWLADHASATSPASLDDEGNGDDADHSEGEPSQIDVVIAYETHFGITNGHQLVIVSLDEDAHRSVCKRMADDQPAATLVAETGVVMAVLRDEADVRFGHSFTDDAYDVDEFSSKEEAFISTLLNEALNLLRSPPVESST